MMIKWNFFSSRKGKDHCCPKYCDEKAMFLILTKISLLTIRRPSSEKKKIKDRRVFKYARKSFILLFFITKEGQIVGILFAG